LTTFNDCFLASAFSNNAIIGADPKNYPPTKWPAGNLFPATAADVNFVNYNGGNGGDYHLTTSSPYKGKGLDGRDLGADIDAVNKYTTGVKQ
jgi:hypothetical protein